VRARHNDGGPDDPEPDCEVCGKDFGDCICHECPHCHAFGDPTCYAQGGHGLVRTDEQIEGPKALEAEWFEDEKSIAAFAQEWTDSDNDLIERNNDEYDDEI
jgi:hypothetical protein